MEKSVFRPPLTLRIILGVLAAGCGLVVAIEVWLLVSRGEPIRLIGAAVLSLPCWLAAAVIRKRVIADAEGIHAAGMMGIRFTAWREIRWIDQTRSSFTVETSHGPISAGWIASSERDDLLRMIVERGRLARSSEALRYGLVARYIPREQAITFVPHNLRKKQDSSDSGEAKAG